MDSPAAETEEWTLVDAEDATSFPDATADSRFKIGSSGISIWTLWAVGSVIDFAVPLYRRILGTEDAIEKTAESTAEAVEKIAKIAEEVTSAIANGLPDGVRLKKTALQMEEICEIVDKDAVKAEAFIQKVDHMKVQVDAVIEPIIEKAEELEKEIREKETEPNAVPDQAN
ncbi:uncharacterized protein LOC122034382 [Zingiber officinale]|uniref:uncharacterized protein LOC122034382 n=1 Tax=Zingiber officinale TaxID=94328 RepID=UPI001C4DB018|nr:uncharacterized protein LOC122034382 [Zingiber officinale]